MLKAYKFTLNFFPCVMVGGAPGFRMERSLKLEKVPQNRLWITVANAMGYQLDTFGKAELCAGGALTLS